MSELSKQVLIITVIIFSFGEEAYTQQGENDENPFPIFTLPGREFKLDYNPELFQGLNPDLMRPGILMNKNIFPDMPLQYELSPYEAWHTPIYNSLDLSVGILNSNFISYPVLGKNAFYLSGTQELIPGVSSRPLLILAEAWSINLRISSVLRVA